MSHPIGSCIPEEIEKNMDNENDAIEVTDGLSGGEIASAVSLFILQALIAIPFFTLTMFLSIAADGCSQRLCNLVVAADAVYMAPIAALCSLAVTIPLTIRSGKRGGSVIIPPLLGVISVIIVGILGIALNHVALIGS